jgi:glycosyltransferase involved in cell wall biosynthesis
MHRLKYWLVPPTFEDEGKNHQAFLLHVILLALISIPLPFVAYLIIRQPEEAGKALAIIAAAEAIAAGVPSILSDQIQIAPPAGADGACLSLPREQQAWTAAILRLVSNAAEAAEISRRARAHAHATYSWDAIAGRLVAMYDAAIEARRTSK